MNHKRIWWLRIILTSAAITVYDLTSHPRPSDWAYWLIPVAIAFTVVMAIDLMWSSYRRAKAADARERADEADGMRRRSHP